MGLLSTSTLTHADYTVGWICALPLEMKAAKAMLDEEHPGLPIPPLDKNTYLLGSISGHNVVIACLPAGVYGTTTATIVAVFMSSTFPNSTTMPLLVGIGGGVPSERHDIRLGDIVVSTPSSDHPAVVQYDRGKTVGTGVLDSRGTLNKPAHILLSAISAIQAQHGQKVDRVAQHISQALSQHELPTYSYPGFEADILYKTGCEHLPESTACEECGLQRVKRVSRGNNSPLIHYGTIGSGNQVIKHAATRDRIAAQHGDILCFEMEAAGIMDYIPCLVIRGICDYADAFKNKEFQGYAAIAAAAFAKELLMFKNPRLYEAPQRSEQAKRRSIMKTLNFSESDNRRAVINNAHPKTCAWLVETPEYLEWIDTGRRSEHHGMLWIKGKPGTGKSTIMKFLLERFEDEIEQGDELVIISFFFNARGQSLEQSTIGMYRSLIHQLLTQIPESYESFEHIATENFKTDIEQVNYLETLFRKVIIQLKSRHILCLIDALDECPEVEIQDMVDCFKELGDMASLCHFQICFSSRHYPKISIDIGLELVLEEEHGHDKDIVDYISSELQIGDGDHAQTLKHNIFKKSQSIFLWVILTVKILKREYSRGRIHTLDQKLRETPQGLDALLSDILLRDTRNFSELVLCMQWVLYSERPLRPQELYFALLSAADTPASWPSSEISMQVMDNLILDCSKGLAEITRTDPPIVQFIHESVREILFKPSTVPNLASLVQEFHQATSHQSLARCCSNYLTSELVTSIDLLARFPVKKGRLVSLLASNGTVIKNPIDESRKVEIEAQKKSLPFLDYSVRFILKHAHQGASTDGWQTKFLQTFDQDRWIDLYQVLTDSKDFQFGLFLAEHDFGSLLMEWACTTVSTDRAKICDVVQYLLRYGNLKTCHSMLWSLYEASSAPVDNFKKKFFDTIYKLLKVVDLHVWSISTRTCLVIHSLARLLIINQTKWQKDDLNTALNFAALLKRQHVIELLLDQGALLAPSTIISVAQELKVYHNREFKVQDTTQTIDVTDSAASPSAKRTTTMDTMSCLRLLEDRGLSINVKNDERVTVLHEASTWADADMMEHLVSASKDINTPNSAGWAALHYAVRYGNVTATRVLLENGAKINMQNSEGETSMHLAVLQGNISLVDYLLHNGANASITNTEGDTPLHWAIRGFHGAIAELLLSKGVSASTRNNDGYTALHFAVQSYDKRLVKLIIQSARARPDEPVTTQGTILSNTQANIKSSYIDRNRDYINQDYIIQATICTPMCLSVLAYGNLGITELMLKHGIDARLQECSHVPLNRAVTFGNLDLVQVLLNHNVDINEQDKLGRTALHEAAIHATSDKISELLFQQSPDLSLVDNDGNTVLHLASYYGRMYIVTELLRHDVNIHVTNHQGRTPFQMAAFGHSEEAVAILWASGSKTEIPARRDESDEEWESGIRCISWLRDASNLEDVSDVDDVSSVEDNTSFADTVSLENVSSAEDASSVEDA